MAQNKSKHLKIISLVLCFLFVFQLAFLDNFQAYASTQPKVTYSITGSPEVDKTIEILVNVSNAQNLYGSSVDFQYDPNLIQVISVNNGNIYGSNSIVTPVNKNNSGQVNLATMMKGNRSGVSGNGTIAVIKAKVLKEGSLNLKTTNGNDTLSLGGNTVRVKLSDNNGKPISYTKEDKQVVMTGIRPLSATLVSDNIPTHMDPGKTYNVSLTFKNTGTETWTDAGKHRLGLDYVSGSSYKEFGLTGRYYLDSNASVKPGESATFSFTVKAPTTEGDYSLNFKMLKEGNSWFGDLVSKEISVKTLPLNYELVSDTIPSTMEGGKSYNVSLTLRNTGKETWTEANKHRLGLDSVSSSVYKQFGLSGRVNLGSNVSVKTGQTVTFSMVMTAPTTGGSYNLDFKMLKEGVNWFGPTTTKTIVVKSSNTTPLDAELVSENIPATMEAGKSYDVQIKLKNTGSETWTAKTKHSLGLDYVDGCDYSSFGLTRRVQLDSNASIAPGQTATFNVKLTAPVAGGQYNLHFRMLKEGVNWFGPTVSKKITVNNSTPLNAAVVSDTIPPTMEAGKTYNVSLTLRNTGAETWTEANKHRLGLDSISSSIYKLFGLSGRVSLGSNVSVKTGETVTFSMTMTAPTTAGSYNLDFKMLKEGVNWFGPTTTKTIVVKASTATPLSAELVSENVPTTMEPGQSYQVSLTYKNTGSETWSLASKHRLGLDYISTDYKLFDVGGRSDFGSGVTVKPGETYTFTMNLKAPSTNGTYSLGFKMLKEGVNWFGPTVEKKVTVSAATRGALLVSENIPENMEPGQVYNVSLTFKNTGTHPWSAGSNYRLGLDYVSGSSYKDFGVGGRVYLGENTIVNPGETVTFTIPLKAPTSNGSYSLAFKMLKEGTAWFGPTVSKTINVKTATYNAEMVSNTIPSTMKAGQSYEASITVKNTGTHPWTAAGNYRLGLDSVSTSYSSFGLAGRVYLGDKDIINPGETATFKITMKAPGSAGSHTLNFKMLKEGVSWFGTTLTKNITVQ